MRECGRMERLIHLHREGERTPEEDRLVRDHTARCSRCAGTLRSVEAMGEALDAARLSGPQPDAGAGLVERTVEEIRRAGGGRKKAGILLRSGPRPAIAFALLCVIVLLGQQGRDAWQTAGMERRLGGMAAGDGSGAVTIANRLTSLAEAVMPRARSGGSGRFSRASSIPPLFIPDFARTDLFRQYAERYPLLATVDPYDGIDERERLILSTEGAAFLEEFRKLLGKGE